MSSTNNNTRLNAQKAAAEVHYNNYNSQREKGATHHQAFIFANFAAARFWAWLISLGILATIVLALVNWSSAVQS